MADTRKRLPLIRTRLKTEDLKRFDQICRSEGKTQAEIARRALLFYLKAYEKDELDAQESKLEARLRKMEDRLAAMVMRTTIDTGVIYQAIYYNMGKEAPKAFMAFYNYAVKRLATKRKDKGEKKMLLALVDELYGTDDSTQSAPSSASSSNPAPGKSAQETEGKPKIRRYTVDE